MNELFIPCGFRCFTKEILQRDYGIIQPSLPFDVGFIHPLSIVRFMKDDVVDITHDTTVPCIKTEDYKYNDKRGVRFQTSTYEEIDLHILNNGYDNRYLDTTRGYYTLVKKYDFVLAHYNWHADSGRLVDGEDINERFHKIQETFTRRKERLFEMIERASIINITFSQERAPSDFLKIDDRYYDCNPVSVEPILTECFTSLTNKPVKFKVIYTPPNK